MADTIELTGILATTDSFERLRLCLVDFLETPAQKGGRQVVDSSWARLRAAVPFTTNYNIPYDFPLNGAPDDAGIRGECWVSLPNGRTKTGRLQKARILNLASELRGKEVVLTVRPKRYSFVSSAAHNYGEEIAGTSLQFVGIEAYTFRRS